MAMVKILSIFVAFFWKLTLPDEVDEDEEERPLHCWEDVLIDFVLFMIIISVSVCYKESSQINFKKSLFKCLSYNHRSHYV